MNTRKFSTTRVAGFTLVELLVVVMVMVILATLLSGVSKKVIDAGNLTKCASRHRAVGVGVFGYAGDNNGQFPQMRTVDWQTPYWPDLIRPYITSKEGSKINGKDQTFQCPCAGIHHNISDFGNNDAVISPASLGGGNLSKRLATILKPSNTIMVTCASVDVAGGKTTGAWYISVGDFLSSPDTHSPKPANRHAGKIPVLFADGHVEVLMYTDLVNRRQQLFNPTDPVN